MALSELRRRKLTREFHLLDLDGNGVLEWADFERLANALAEARGLSRDSATRAELLEALRRFWAILSATSDRNLDGRVSEDEYLAFYDYLVQQAGDATWETLPPWFQTLVDVRFTMLDDNGDGVIGPDELGMLLAAHGIAPDQHGIVFDRLDRNGTGALDREDLRRIVHEFYFGDDDDAPGNDLYGILA